jgi:hypothetical protein
MEAIEAKQSVVKFRRPLRELVMRGPRAAAAESSRARPFVLRMRVEIAAVWTVPVSLSSDSGSSGSGPSHAGRRTAITWWAEAGYDERDVMLWVGHEDPVLTLRLYRQARNRPRDPRVLVAMAEVPAKSGERRVTCAPHEWWPHVPDATTADRRAPAFRASRFLSWPRSVLGMAPILSPKTPGNRGYPSGLRAVAKPHSCAKSSVGLLIVVQVVAGSSPVAHP